MVDKKEQFNTNLLRVREVLKTRSEHHIRGQNAWEGMVGQVCLHCGDTKILWNNCFFCTPCTISIARHLE